MLIDFFSFALSFPDWSSVVGSAHHGLFRSDTCACAAVPFFFDFSSFDLASVVGSMHHGLLAATPAALGAPRAPRRDASGVRGVGFILRLQLSDLPPVVRSAHHGLFRRDASGVRGGASLLRHQLLDLPSVMATAHHGLLAAAPAACAALGLSLGFYLSTRHPWLGAPRAPHQLSLRRPRGVVRLIGQRHRVRYQLSYRLLRGVVCSLGQRPRVRLSVFRFVGLAVLFVFSAASCAPFSFLIASLAVSFVASNSGIGYAISFRFVGLAVSFVVSDSDISYAYYLSRCPNHGVARLLG